LPAEQTVAFSVDGREVAPTVEPRMLLLDYLTFGERCTGVHDGCCEGVCGACTVWVDGQPTRSCLTLVVQVEGRAVTTPEGALHDERFESAHQALAAEHAIQCGYCTPGILMSVLPDLTDPAADVSVERALSGNVCRCGGYASILRALQTWHDEQQGAARR
jgi:aerobic-type carbon monoxide dehydrogenase small subunit (CoxS/CutS family)